MKQEVTTAVFENFSEIILYSCLVLSFQIDMNTFDKFMHTLETNCFKLVMPWICI